MKCKMINLCVPAIFDDKYFETIANMNRRYKNSGICISEVYGSLPQDVIGSIRPAFAINKCSSLDLRKYIDILHKEGISFDYVINSTISPIPQQDTAAIMDFIGQLVNLGIDSITISNPYLIHLVSTYYPMLKICASICNEISNLHQIEEFDKLGVDCIVVDRDSNRHFSFLRRARDYKKIKLLCNSWCLFQCINVQYHANYSSFYSNSNINIKESSYEMPFCSKYCRLRRFSNPIEHIKSQWIRPEDLVIYSCMGIEYFKLDGRDKDGNYMLEVIEAYLRQRYEGNFLYLLNRRYTKKYECFGNNIFDSFESSSKSIDDEWMVWIENRELDGFISDLILKNQECTADCQSCNICNHLSSIIHIDATWQKQMCAQLENNM